MVARLAILVLLTATSVAMGSALGLGLNQLNVMVSGEYFEIVVGAGLGPMSTRDVALLHGVIEGGVAGAAFGILLAVLAAGTGWGHLRFAALMRPLLAGYLGAVTCILLFGAGGLVLGSLDPVAYEGMFPAARGASNIAAFGWVGGSIWGGYAGAVVGFMTAAIVWVRQLLNSAWLKPGFDVLPSRHKSEL